MEDKIKLLLQYMKKEKEITLEYDKEEGIDVNAEDYKLSLVCVERVKSFINYRNIRVEESWYSKLMSGDNSRQTKERLNELDAERSRRHSLALNSILDFNRTAEMHDLPKFYEGELLSSNDIENYKNIPVRKEMTAFFLQFIDTLSRVPGYKMEEYFKEVGIDVDAKEENDFIRSLQRGIDKVNHEYGVKKTLLDDDGDIEFEDDNKFDSFGR